MAIAVLAGVWLSDPADAQAPHAADRRSDSTWSVSPGAAPLVTVADLIEMTTLGSRAQGYGDEDYATLAPDGAHVATVVKRGNLARNTMDYTLLVFQTADLLKRPRLDTVVQLSSTSNRPAIGHVRWLADNSTLVFLGERPNELPQIYTLDTQTRQLTQRTHAATVITAFDVSARGDVVVYAAEQAPDTAAYATMRAHGFVLDPRAFVGDVIAGQWGIGGGPAWVAREPRALQVVRDGQPGQQAIVTTVPLPDSATGYRNCHLGTLSVAPSGDAATLECRLESAPATWHDYRQQEYRHIADRLGIAVTYVVLDLTTGHARRLLDAPSRHTSLVWAPDGRSVVLANAMLPLDVADSTERIARATRQMVAEVDVRTGAVTIVARRDSLTVLSWDARSGLVALVPGAYFRPNATARVYYRKTAAGWTAVPPGAVPPTHVPALVIDQGMNTPARLVTIDPTTSAPYVVYDPNPGLLTRKRFGRETVLHWTTKAHASWVGGLYWPPDYVPGRRYPLVIQAHGFDSTTFWPDGIFSTGEAAQPLAGHGVFVLQMSDPPGDQWETPREGPLAMAGMEGAVDALDSLGLIDRAKVGVQGFSRTCYYVLYLLTHSRYPIAAATVTDGVDVSYLQHLLFKATEIGSGRRDEDTQMNGGPPFGAALASWRERAPGFNLDHIVAPLQLTALQPTSLLSEWEPYAGLLLQGKPVEMVYIPDGEHILTKPWERLTSQQGVVDWYRFWLKGEEDPDPAKAEQYTRWRGLRAQRDAGMAKPATAQGR